MEISTKTRDGSHRYGIVTICVLTAGWFAMSARAEDKPAASDGQVKKTVVAKKAKQLFYPALTEREEKLLSALQSDTEVNFPEIPLSEAMNYLSELHNVPIVIHRKYLEDYDVSVDQPINVSLKDISLKNALIQILDPIDLTYVVDRDLILITPKDQAAEMMKTRVYPVGDLCHSRLNGYQVLNHAIRNANLGDWKSEEPQRVSGGFGAGSAPRRFVKEVGGTISEVAESQSLVISQTYHAHNAIMELLTQLRQARADQPETAGQKPIELR